VVDLSLPVRPMAILDGSVDGHSGRVTADFNRHARALVELASPAVDPEQRALSTWLNPASSAFFQPPCAGWWSMTASAREMLTDLLGAAVPGLRGDDRQRGPRRWPSGIDGLTGRMPDMDGYEHPASAANAVPTA
jgi:hypothetical protein